MLQPEPLELQLSPNASELRLVHTRLSDKPLPNSFLVTLITVATMCFITFFYWRDPWGWSELLPAIRRNVFVEGEWWRLFTALFIHSDFQHLLSNMFMLWIFTFFIYGYFGFTVFPLMAVPVAALVNAVAIATYPSEVRLLGASGLVYVLGGAWLTFYFLIQHQYKIFNRSLRTLGLAIMIFWPTSFEATTSYRTHGIGFVAGMVMALGYFFKNRQAIRRSERFEPTEYV